MYKFSNYPTLGVSGVSEHAVRWPANSRRDYAQRLWGHKTMQDMIFRSSIVASVRLESGVWQDRSVLSFPARSII